MLKRLLTLSLIILGAIGMNAQTISGTVTSTNGSAAIANHTVYIYSLDSNSSPYNVTTTTNANGAYSFTSVPSNNSGYLIYVYDCQQQQQSQFTSSNTGTANFSICVSGNPTNCTAAFFSYPDSTNLNLIYFYDQSTGSPTSWTWNFGDGNSASTQHPNHTYAANGTYTVSLIISSTNCSDTTSQTITIGSGSTTCQAIFNSYPDTANPNTINFIDASTGSPYGWNWNFGDGTSSNLQHPTHAYASAGTYSVSLTITAGQPSQPCTSTATQNVIISGGTLTYAISGSVYANSSLVLQGTVALFDTQTSQFIASTPIDSTGYYFANVAVGIYNLFAIPDTTTAIGQNFAPTYYGDIIFWSGATAVGITNANQTSKIINLVTIPSVPGGNGSISGNVGTGSKAGTADAVVNLLDNTLQLVATTKTDANGDYAFANLAYDTYKIWVEIAGKTTTPITVTLTSTSGSSNANDFIVTNNTVVPKTTSVNNNLLVGEFKLYPNPVSNVLNIEIKTEENGIYSFNMFNVTGQLISSEQINITAGSNMIKLNTNELSQGTYILRIQDSNNNSIQKLFVK